LSIAVTPEEHQFFTNSWRSELGYNNQTMEWITTNVNEDIIWEKAQQICADYPAKMDAAYNTIFSK